MINPLVAPEPSEETGPGTHFRSTFAPAKGQGTSNPLSSSTANLVQAVHKDEYYDPAVDPARSNMATRTTTPPKTKGASPLQATSTSPSGSPAGGVKNSGSRSRGVSLSERFPGDMTHKPLDMIRKDSKRAGKTHRKRQSGIDTIDALDAVPGGGYHHEGPFDATLLTRNMVPGASPVAAVAESNAEALKATPAEFLSDSLVKHRPLDGIAVMPPGEPDQFGRVLEYQEMNINAEGRDVS
jgi:hypothetical protein